MDYNLDDVLKNLNKLKTTTTQLKKENDRLKHNIKVVIDGFDNLIKYNVGTGKRDLYIMKMTLQKVLENANAIT